MKKFVPPLALAAIPLMGPIAPASALDICISCNAPEAHYTCRLDLPGANPRDLRLQLLCITQIAQQGGHATCQADRASAEACQGAVKVVGAPAIEDAAPAVSPPSPAPVAPPPPETKAPGKRSSNETVVPKTPDAPKTVLEMVEKGAAGTGETLQNAGGAVKDAAQTTSGTFGKAGAAVGSAAKKTWKCLSSLFGDC
jgi:hypothetical protein